KRMSTYGKDSLVDVIYRPSRLFNSATSKSTSPAFAEHLLTSGQLCCSTFNMFVSLLDLKRGQMTHSNNPLHNKC
ncbi:MAG: hypothetical protein VX295_03220, partial [Pseudomonadota bacterium]|nr:hypothetical protein [Pseudomonadota bacterium]